MVAEDRIAANLRHMQLHECKPQPKVQSPTSVTRGFEAVAFPKIVRELQDPQLVVRQKGLLAARELLGSATGHVQCIAAGITPAVVHLLQDDDDVVREGAAGTMEYIVGKELGARDVIQHAGVSRLVACLTDKELRVRDAAYAALLEASRFDAIRRELCQQRALIHLLRLATKPGNSPQLLLQGLMVLNECVQVKHNEAALKQLVEEGDAIPSLATVLMADNVKVQEHAACLLGALTSGSEDAKVVAVKAGTVPSLLNLLASSSSQQVLLAAATALMNMTVCRDGKYAVIQKEDGPAQLVKLLKPQHVQLAINAMETITNVCEAPEARSKFEDLGTPGLLFNIFQGDNSQLLKERAAQAMRQCAFKHLPYQVLQGRQLPNDIET